MAFVNVGGVRLRSGDKAAALTGAANGATARRPAAAAATGVSMRAGGRGMPQRQSYAPFGVFSPLFQDMFGAMMGPMPANVFNAPMAQNANCAMPSWLPQGEFIERENDYLVRLELAGVSKDDVKTTVRENTLIISGEKRDSFKQQQPAAADAAAAAEGADKEEAKPAADEAEKVRRQRFGWSSYGAFQRAVPLPRDADRSAIKAAMKDGVLTVQIKKLVKAQPAEDVIDIADGDL